MEAETQAGSAYVLGYSGSEQNRLLRQAALVAPTTERLFREAGIGPGQRVLEIGSGLGDVAQIAARLVGAGGRVVGVEQDATSIARARQRTDAAGLTHVTFIHADVNGLRLEETFDAVVGRFVLNHSSDATALLRSLTRSLRRGGVVAFQEVAFGPALAAAAGIPQWQAVLGAIDDILRCSGLSPRPGAVLVSRLSGGWPLRAPYAPRDSVRA